MSKVETLKREIFICDCHSIEHQYGFWYDEDDNELWFEPHLVIYPWYLRIWIGIKYIFGYKTRYGSWDSMIINIDDIPRLKDYLNKVIKESKIRELAHENQEKEFNI